MQCVGEDISQIRIVQITQSINDRKTLTYFPVTVIENVRITKLYDCMYQWLSKQCVFLVAVQYM